MAENREYLVHKEDCDSINISEEVLLSIVTKTLSEIEGAGALMNATYTEQIAGQIKGKKPLRGIRVEAKEDGVNVDVHMTVKYGYSIPEVAEKAQESIAASIGAMTGFDVKSVNVQVGGVVFN
ncbi:MAG: Asp23/Gls24 family envelope stress response protein [Oscillospiraceae bacterium]|nr:Asp23/Gls24 family envelope stress response protein [Oscillospiraceae bacterium]